MPPSPSRAIVRLTTECDNSCGFCAQAGVEPFGPDGPTEPSSPRDIDASELARLRQQHDELTFIGGEPTLAPRLVEWIAEARDAGFRAIGLQTNAGSLADDPDRLDQLVEAGLGDLQLSIHAPTAIAHDFHTGRAGSFDGALALLGRAQRLGLTCVVATVITRSNFRELPRMPAMLRRSGVAAWLLEVVRPFGRAGADFARVVPRFGMALPWTLHGLEQARKVDLPAWIRGAPMCALGPFVSHASELWRAEQPRVHPPVCEPCPARQRCVGVDRRYLDHFGTSEIDPRRLDAAVKRHPASDLGRERLLRMFVGVGELVEPLAERSERGSTSDAASKHRRLPVLAKGGSQQAESVESEPE